MSHLRMVSDSVDQNNDQRIKAGSLIADLPSPRRGFQGIERYRQEIWDYIQYREGQVTWPGTNEGMTLSSDFNISASTALSPVQLVNKIPPLPLDACLPVSRGEGGSGGISLAPPALILPHKGGGVLMRFRISLLSVFMSITMLFLVEAPVFSAELNANKLEMKKLLPQEILAYKSEGKDEFYDRQTTFRYMDGAAELYRSFAFKLLLVRRYLKANAPAIVVELFDMGLAKEAFGIFTFETGGEDAGVGQGSDYGGGLLRFWKGKYFVNVYAEQETPSTKHDVLEIAKAIAGSLGQEGQKPKLIHYLPEEGLSERSIRYFHLHQSLNYHYFVSHQNILRLGEKTNAVLASYLFPQTKDKTFLLLIQYPTKKLAGEALQSFVKAYMAEASASKTIKTENGRWAAAQSHREYVMVVFDAPDKGKAEELIQATKEKVEARRP